MNQSKVQILSRLSSMNPISPVLAPWVSRRDFPDRKAQFKQALEKAKGECRLVADLAEATEVVAQLLAAAGAREVVVQQNDLLDSIDWHGLVPGITLHQAGNTVDDWRKYCADADAGISSAVALLAETGSLVLYSGAGNGRLTTLLPPLHIALVPESHLMVDLFELVDKLPTPLPANIVIVSGPSKTADIEQTMVVGVHGPLRLVVIVIEGH